MAKKWTSINNLILRDGVPVASGYAAQTAEFLAAAAEHFREFLGATAHIEDSDVEPDLYKMDQGICCWPNCVCDEGKCYYSEDTEKRGAHARE